MDRVIAIKITSDGRAFVVDQAANADAAAKLQKQVLSLEQEVERLQRKLNDAGNGGSPALKRVGDQAEKTAQQLRQVGPQVTDIVTQVAAGQNPLQIFIQQGGQLKDVFGGAAPAAKALGGYVLGLISPLSIAAVAAGGLTAAWYLGREESVKFTRQLILSGNAAGVTGSQYAEMASGLSAISGSKGAALEALEAMAQGGRVAADEIQRFTGIAQQLDRLVGKPVADTAKEFQALGEAPVTASLKLTQTYNYLTAAVYQQIKALDDQGRHEDAAALAQAAFAQALEQRVHEMQANLGTLERGWQNVKNAIKGAGDALLSIGRVPTLGEQVAQLKREIAKAEGVFDASAFGGNAEARAKLAQNRQLLAVLEGQAQAEARSAIAARDRQTTLEARARFDQMREAALSNQEKLERAIAKAEADGLASGASRAEIDKVIANERRKLVDQEAQEGLDARIARVKRAGEAEAVLVKENIDRINGLYKLGAVTQAEYIDLVGTAEVKLLEDDRARLIEQLSIAKKKANSQREVADLEGQLIVQAEKIAARRRKIDEDQLTRRQQLERAARAFYNAETSQWEQQQADEQTAADKRYEALQVSVTDYIHGLQQESDALDFQISLMGRSAVEQQQMIELHRIDLGLREKLRDIDRQAAGGQISGERADFERQRAREAAAEAAAKVETGIWVKEWSHANAEIGDSLYLAITGRGKDARQKLMALFEQTVLRPTISGVMQPIANGLTNALLGGGGAQGTGSALSSVGSAASMYSSASGIGSAFMAGYSGTVATGVGGVGATFGVVDTAAVGLGASTSGGIMAGIETAAASIPVAGWIALAGLALYSIFGDSKGGPKGNAFAQTPGMSGIGALPGEQDSQLTGAAQLAVNTITGAYKAAADALGIQAGQLGVAIQANTDPEGDSLSHLAAVVSLNGRQVYDRNNLTNPAIAADNSKWEDIARDPAAMEAAVNEAIARGLLSAIQASDLSGKLKTYFDSLNPLEMSADQINAAVTAATNAQQFYNVVGKLGPAFSSLADLSIEAANEMVMAEGGAQASIAKWADYYNNFTSDAQKKADTIDAIVRTLNAAGLDVTAGQIGAMTRESFASLMQAEVALGPAGQTAVNALLSVEGAIASIVPVTQGLARDATGALFDLAAAEKSYYDNFTSAEQKRLDTALLIQAKLAAAGQGYTLEQILGATREDFQVGVEAFRAMGEAGRPAYEALLSVVDLFLSITPASVADTVVTLDTVTNARNRLIEEYQREQTTLDATVNRWRDFARNIRDFRDSLLLSDLSPLTPAQRYAEAQRQFETISAAADAGDTTAQGQLQGAAQAFLEASRDYYASSDQFTVDFNRVQEALTRSANHADATADVAQLQLDAINHQLDLLTSIDHSAVTIASALHDYQEAVLAALAAGLAVDPRDVQGALGSAGGGAAGGAGSGTGGSGAGGGTGGSGSGTAPSSNAAFITNFYQTELGRAPDTQGLAFWVAKLDAGESREQVIAEITNAVINYSGSDPAGLASQQFYFQKHGMPLPQYADGGWHSGGWALVGERGPELAYMPPARIYTAQDTQAMQGGNGALLAEVRAMIQRLASLEETVAAGARMNAAATERNTVTLSSALATSASLGAHARVLEHAAALR